MDELVRVYTTGFGRNGRCPTDMVVEPGSKSQRHHRPGWVNADGGCRRGTTWWLSKLIHRVWPLIGGCGNCHCLLEVGEKTLQSISRSHRYESITRGGTINSSPHHAETPIVVAEDRWVPPPTTDPEPLEQLQDPAPTKRELEEVLLRQQSVRLEDDVVRAQQTGTENGTTLMMGPVVTPPDALKFHRTLLCRHVLPLK